MRLSSIRFLLVALSLLSALSIGSMLQRGFAQGPQGGAAAGPVPTLRATARLVVLDVVVTDAKGNVVTDLKKDDFTVMEAQQLQRVTNFDTAAMHLPRPEANVHSTAELDKQAPDAPVNIILLDEFNTRFEDMAFARYSLKKYLEKQPDKLTLPTMLLAVSLQKFTVLNDYTQDKRAVLDALEHHFALYPWAVHDGGWVPERLATAFGTLERVAEAVQGHEGHKNMIWIGRGFPAMRMENLPMDTQNRVDNAVQLCVNMLRDSRVTLYAIDPAGLEVNPGKYGTQARLDDPFGGNYQFSGLARATGGRALYGYNDVDTQITASAQDGASFYTMSYRPTTGSMDPRKFRRIEVTVNRPDMTVTTREGYYVEHGPGGVNVEKPSARLKFDLLTAESSQMVYDAVPVTVTQSAEDKDSFVVGVGASGLVWTPATATQPRHAMVVVMATSFDKKGKELKRVAKEVTSNAPAAAASTGRIEVGLKLPMKLERDSKAVRVRFVVRVNQTGREGTADFDLTK